MQGPFTRELNEAMLRQVGAQWLVTKDSGTVGGTAEKLAAARDVGARCIVVTRPAEGDGALSLREVEDALLRELAAPARPPAREEERPEQARPVQARHPPIARGRRPELAQAALQ